MERTMMSTLEVWWKKHLGKEIKRTLANIWISRSVHIMKVGNKCEVCK